MYHSKASSTPTGQVGDHSSLGSLSGRGLWVPSWLVAERGHSSGMELVLAPTSHLLESSRPQRRKRALKAHFPGFGCLMQAARCFISNVLTPALDSSKHSRLPEHCCHWCCPRLLTAAGCCPGQPPGSAAP